MRAVLPLFIFLSFSAWAYIPPYSMIMTRTAENHGRGTYVIEQDVVYKVSDSDKQVVHETWTVTDEAHMRLNFEGVGALKDAVKGTIVYENHTRILNENGGNKTQRLGDDWLEPFFHYRYSKNMRGRLVQLKIAPPESLREEAPLKADGPPDYTPPSFVRLSRLNGMVTWSVEKTPNSPDQPGIWIQQDQFVVNRVRVANKDSVDADDYVKYDGGFYAPRIRTYHWNDRNVVVQLKNVKSLGTKAGKATSSTTGLVPFQFSGSDVIRDFYLRFR
jgi:hypothetical protein